MWFKKNPFLRKYVQILLAQESTGTVDSPGDATTHGASYAVKIPVGYKGWLLAEDKELYYMGDDKNSIAFSLRKQHVTMIELVVAPLPVKSIKGKTFMVSNEDKYTN